MKEEKNKETLIDVEAEKRAFEEFSASVADVIEPIQEVPEDVPEIVGSFSTSRKGQTFSKYRPDYRLNVATNTVEEVGQIDVDELVHSSYDSTLDKILDNYLNETQDIKPIMLDGADKVVCNFEKLQRKIDQYTTLSMEAEELRKTFKLSDDLSFDQVFKAVGELKEKSERDISKYAKAIKEIRNKPKPKNEANPKEKDNKEKDNEKV